MVRISMTLPFRTSFYFVAGKNREFSSFIIKIHNVLPCRQIDICHVGASMRSNYPSTLDELPPPLDLESFYVTQRATNLSQLFLYQGRLHRQEWSVTRVIFALKCDLPEEQRCFVRMNAFRLLRIFFFPFSKRYFQFPFNKDECEKGCLQGLSLAMFLRKLLSKNSLKVELLAFKKAVTYF